VRANRSSASPTMAEIAVAAGVSQSTVSRVLSPASRGSRISAATRDRVTTVAREYGYRPNPLARGLRGAATMLLGVVVGDITDPFSPGLVEALSAAALSRGYNVVLGHARGSAREAVALRSVLETRHCDAIIILGDLREQPRILAELAETGVPSVNLGRGPDSGGVSIDVDNRAGVRAIMEHLAGLGHSRVAYVGARAYGDFPARRAAYLDFMEERGLAVPRRYDQRIDNSPEAGAEALRSLLDIRPRPTAVVVATDLMAVGVLFAAHEAGLAVPDDMSVTGFDDLPIAGFTVPPLTTLRMPSTEMATAAVDAAIALIKQPEAGQEPLVRLVAPTLVIRASTGLARSDGDGPVAGRSSRRRASTDA
jgi:DNA-binding LacI/PurR family transcriptional regulator